MVDDTGLSGAQVRGALPSLICDTCAARKFPEASVDPDGEVVFRYGDDGPVSAIEVTVDFPGVDVAVLPYGDAPFPSGV